MVSHKPGLVRLPGVRLRAVVGRNTKEIVRVPVNHVPVVCKKIKNTGKYRKKRVQHAMHTHIGNKLKIKIRPPAPISDGSCPGISILFWSRLTTLGGASEKCPYSRSAVIPEVSLYVSQLDGTLLWARKFCRYSRIVVRSAVVISEVDCIQGEMGTHYAIFGQKSNASHNDKSAPIMFLHCSFNAIILGDQGTSTVKKALPLFAKGG